MNPLKLSQCDWLQFTSVLIFILIYALSGVGVLGGGGRLRKNSDPKQDPPNKMSPGSDRIRICNPEAEFMKVHFR
jgi:hypothetical protein